VTGLSYSSVLKSKIITPEHVFRFFKYAIYILLAYNAFLFFGEDVAASAETFGDNITWRNFTEAYSASIDTAAWVVLLVIFELETAVLPDHLLKGKLKWLLKSFSTLAYFFIIFSFYGYCVKYGVVSHVVPFDIADVCSLMGSDFTWVAALDEYLPNDQAACTSLNGQSLLQISGTQIIGSEAALAEATRLATVDIVNASDWLIIVMLLEIEVFLQLLNKLGDKLKLAMQYSKGVLYLILFCCAAYWGFKGSFLDFWDAFLWLVAFIFIELNIFQWSAETEAEKEHVMKV